MSYLIPFVYVGDMLYMFHELPIFMKEQFWLKILQNFTKNTHPQIKNTKGVNNKYTLSHNTLKLQNVKENILNTFREKEQFYP